MGILNVLWRALVVAHLTIITANFIAFLCLPFLVPWYVSCPLCTMIARLSFSSSITCPLTWVENKMRHRLGKAEIQGFMRHYVLNRKK